jgi:hypothetical protein
MSRADGRDETPAVARRSLFVIKSTLAPLAFFSLVAAGCSSPAKVSLGHGELMGAGGGATHDGGTMHSSAGTSVGSGGKTSVMKPAPSSTAAPTASAAPTTTPPAATVGIDGGGGPITPCNAIDTSGGIANADVYVMLDQSSSMGDPYPIASLGSWWDVTRKAFTSAADDPALAGLVIGLQYFPLDGLAPDSCSAHYEMPEVELAPLPGNAGTLKASLAAHDPAAFTPTAPALTGAIRHMKEWAPAHPGRMPLVIFVTDGFPTECDPQDINDVASIAREGRDTQPAVRVGVIGLNLGAGGANLDAIARGGGTGSARLIDGGDAEAQLKSAIQAIVTSPVSCD